MGDGWRAVCSVLWFPFGIFAQVTHKCYTTLLVRHMRHVMVRACRLFTPVHPPNATATALIAFIFYHLSF
jgi:hypothetical protein